MFLNASVRQNSRIWHSERTTGRRVCNLVFRWHTSRKTSFCLLNRQQRPTFCRHQTRSGLWLLRSFNDIQPLLSICARACWFQMERWLRLPAPSPTWAKLTQLRKHEQPVSLQAVDSLLSRPNFQQFAQVIKAHYISKRTSTLRWHLPSSHSDTSFSVNLARKLST